MERRYGLYLADLDRDRTASHGIMGYALKLLEYLPSMLDRDETLVCYVNDTLSLPAVSTPSVEFHSVRKSRSAIQRLRIDHASWNWVRRDRLDVIHYPKGYVPLLRWGGRTSIVTTLHDDITLQYAAGRWRHPQPMKARYFAWLTKRSIRASDVILTVSNVSSAALREWGTRLGKNIDPVVTLLGPVVGSQKPRTARDQTLLTFASPMPHKRSQETIQFCRSFIRDERADLHLVVVGRQGKSDSNITVAAPVSDEYLAELMRAAAAVVVGSEYEGFGLVPLDAHSLGTPAVFALNDAARELYDDLPGGFEVGDEAGFRRAMKRALAIQGKVLADIGDHVRKKFDWCQVARITAEAYREAASSPVQVDPNPGPSFDV